MGQAGDQGSKGDEEYSRKEHVGAADWTRARGGGEQLIPIQGTVVVDLEQNRCQTPSGRSRIF